MYLIVRILGWCIVIMYALSVKRHLSRIGPFAKIEAFKPFRVFLTKYHKLFGVLTVLIAFIHATLAFTNVSKSITGSLTMLTMLIAVTFGILLNLKKISADKVKIHRTIAWIIPVLIVLHLLFPYVLVN